MAGISENLDDLRAVGTIKIESVNLSLGDFPASKKWKISYELNGVGGLVIKMFTHGELKPGIDNVWKSMMRWLQDEEPDTYKIINSKSYKDADEPQAIPS